MLSRVLRDRYVLPPLSILPKVLRSLLNRIELNWIEFTGERLTRMSTHRSSVPNLNDPSPLLPRFAEDWEKARSQSQSVPPTWAPQWTSTPTCAPWRMNDKWTGNSFLLGFSSLANHGGYLSCFLSFPPTYLPTYIPTYLPTYLPRRGGAIFFQR
jgi:hypothetical protein